MSRNRLGARLSAWLFACLLLVGAAQAASRLVFPRIDLSGDSITGVAIVNPNPAEASVVLTAYGSDGDRLELPSNPVTVLIPAGSQYAKTATEIFAIPSGGESVAWLEATSSSDDVTGFFLFLNAEVSIFDGSAIPEPNEEIVFTEVRVGPGESTELNLANPNAVAADVTLTLHSPGTSSTRSLRLPASGVVRLDAGSLFSIDRSDEGIEASFISASSEAPLVGFELVYTTGDILGLSATPQSERLDRLVFPQLAVLEPFRTELSLVNLSDTATIATVTAHQPSGEPFQPAAGSNPVNVSLPPLSARRYDLETLFGFAGDQTLDGWLEIKATSPSINGSLTYHVTTIGSVASVASVAQGSDRALFSHIATSLGYFTGLALLNPGGLTANVRIVALQRDGSIVGSRSLVLRPGQRVSDVLTNLISGSSGLAGGFIWIESDLPLYLTSLFGRLESGVLANIPPQPVPEDFQPEQPESVLAVSPAFTVLQPGHVQAFSLSGIAAGPIHWTVEGEGSESTEFGSVDDQGRYTAPDPAPAQLPVSISASTQTQASGASVDILSKSQLTQNLGVVQSVAYLQSSQRLYLAELQGSSTLSEARVTSSEADDTSIVDITEDPPLPVATFSGEVITAMVPYLAQDGREYLILANETTGSLIRLDPLERTQTEVLSGLDQPSALVIDEVEGQILVAEAEQVRTFPLEPLNTHLSGSAAPPVRFQSTAGGKNLFEAFRGRLAVDQCTGNVYASVPSEGLILEFVRRSGAVRILASGLQDPGALLGFYRRGMSCPAAFHLLVAERGAGRIGIVTPSDRDYRPWAEAADPTAVILLPDDNPIVPGSAVLIAESGTMGGELSIVPLPGIYLAAATNLPRRFPLPPCSITQLTSFSEGQAESVALSGDGRRIVFSTSQDPVGQNSDGNEELFLFDRDTRQLSQITDSRQGRNTAALLDHDGSRVVFGSTAGFGIQAPPGPRILTFDLDTGSHFTLTDTPGAGYSIDASGTLVAFAGRGDPLGSNPDGNSEIFLFRMGDAAPSQLTQTAGTANVLPALSADGQQLVFLSNASFPGVETPAGLSLFLMDLDSRTLQFVSEVSAAFEPIDQSPPLLDRNGGRIVFESDLDLTGQNPLGRSAVFVFDVETNQIRQVSSGAGTIRLDSVSADGMLAALTSDTNVSRINPDRNAEIFFFDLSGGNPAQVTRSRRAWNGSARVAEDGGSIVFISNADYVGENSAHRGQIFGGACRPGRE